MRPIEVNAAVLSSLPPTVPPKRPFTTEVYQCYMYAFDWQRYEYWWRCRVGWEGFDKLKLNTKYQLKLKQTTLTISIHNFSYTGESVNCKLQVFFTNDKNQIGQIVGREISSGTRTVPKFSSSSFTLNCYPLNRSDPFELYDKYKYLGFEILINPSYCGTYTGPQFSNELVLSIMQ